jgi:hypothetical protein
MRIIITGIGTPSSQSKIAGMEKKSFLNGFVNTRSVRNRAIRIQEKLRLMKAMSSSLHPPTVFTGAAKQSIFPRSSH